MGDINGELSSTKPLSGSLSEVSTMSGTLTGTSYVRGTLSKEETVAGALTTFGIVQEPYYETSNESGTTINIG